MRRRLRNPVLLIVAIWALGAAMAAWSVPAWSLKAVMGCALVGGGTIALVAGLAGSAMGVAALSQGIVKNFRSGHATFNKQVYVVRRQPIQFLGVQLLLTALMILVPAWFLGVSIWFVYGAFQFLS